MSAPPSAPPRPAATVVLLRDCGDLQHSGDCGNLQHPEILMVRRTRGASFMADAWVFPGGRLEPEDGEGDDAFARAAARELREEAGVVIDPASLVPLARWVTPSAEPKRFDARFFLAKLTDGQIAKHDAVETVDALWSPARALLARYAKGELKLPPPTIRNLEELEAHTTADAALAWARARPIATVLPKLVPLGATLAIVLPWDPEYPSLPGEGEPIDAAHPIAHGRTRFVLEEGRWWGRGP